MPSQVALCNLALDKVSEKPILTMIDTTLRAQVCAREYQPALDQVLEEGFWNFAQTRAVLVATTAPIFGYSNAWTLPVDFIAVEIFNNASVADYDPEQLYKIESNLLLTDQDVANIVYTRDGTRFPEDENTFGALMTPLFVSAFTTLLASKIAPSVRNDGPAYAMALLQVYRGEVSKARTKGANQRKRQPVRLEAESRVRGSRLVSTAG